MPVYIAVQALYDGLGSIPFAIPILKILPWLLGVYLLKWYFGGARNQSERNMHSKVVMMTGGTSGIGAEVARELASRGAQLILLTQQPLNDAFLIDYIMDLRNSTNNELINAEQVDLSSLHSIRQFATKWVDNAPPRRLDMIILCAKTLTPIGGKIAITEDGMESNWGINYLANFHLLSILSPALRAQPPDRDVRVIVGTCSDYLAGQLSVITGQASGTDIRDQASSKSASQKKKPTSSPSSSDTSSTLKLSTAHATSKLALTTFALAFQKHLSAYKRPDGFDPNTRVILVHPGFVRTPGMRRYLSMGSLLGLLLYLVLYPLWWLVLKSPSQGAQGFLYAAMEAKFGRGEGGWLVRECCESAFARNEVRDEAVQKGLWELSERSIERAEKEGAVRRAVERKERERREGERKVEERGEDGRKESEERKTGSRRSRKAG